MVEILRYSMIMARFELQELNIYKIRDVRCKISIKGKIFFFFFFESGLLSVEAGPHVGLYIVVRYSSGS